MTTPRYSHCLVPTKGKIIYVCGGYNENEPCQLNILESSKIHTTFFFQNYNSIYSIRQTLY